MISDSSGNDPDDDDVGKCADERYTRCRRKIYMIQCNRCNLQYIGETKRRLKDRFNEHIHRRTIDNPDAKSEPTTAAKHFLSCPNHTANDRQLIPIEKNLFQSRLHSKG